MEGICIIIALLGLMYFAYRGWSIILIAPIFAGVAALASMFNILPVYTELYMTRLAEYVKTYYPIFLFGAIFAKLMEKGGLASAIAAKIVEVIGEKRAVLAVLLGCGALTYGGLSVFVVAFVMYPFGAYVFRKADIPKRLLPATLWSGIFSFAMVALPGTPQIQNIIPSSYFETSTWSAPILGMFAAVLFLLIGWGWVGYRAKTLKAKVTAHIPKDAAAANRRSVFRGIGRFCRLFSSLSSILFFPIRSNGIGVSIGIRQASTRSLRSI